MNDLFDFTPPSRRFAVMGNPVAHSRSPQIHQHFGEQCGIDLEYDRIQVDPGGFDQAVSHFAANRGRGLNITVPFKVDAFKLCQGSGNHLSERAEQARAVNTLSLEKGERISGDNTDGIGLVNDLVTNIGLELTDRQILVLGAGGAVRGVIGPLLDCNPASLIVANRTASRASDLATSFTGNITATGLAMAAPGAVDLVINGTATSLDGGLPDFDSGYIGMHTVVYDMMYAEQPTRFMKWCLDHGAARAFDGIGMLVEQAAESFYIWHGKRPDTAPVIATLKRV